MTPSNLTYPGKTGKSGMQGCTVEVQRLKHQKCYTAAELKRLHGFSTGNMQNHAETISQKLLLSTGLQAF